MSVRQHATKELISYIFGVLYAVTVTAVQQDPNFFRTLKLGTLQRVVIGSHRIQRLASRIGDSALDEYKREIGA